MNTGLPDKTDYDYDLFEPVAAHMKLAAAQLIAGMRKPISPREHAGGTLAMIPKRKNMTLDHRMGEEGWGLHAIQGFSWFKILVWIAALTAFGLSFVLFWLLFVDRTDLQNAFVPATFLSTMIFIGLAVPQILRVA